ncbi:hypothetical protein T4A_2288 [Trichinella pseudospiralis]|uniref:Uncharacterized protein n=1 Tax=Trichinella pseudospiralis TaxID=6337 RepID=A0A0V1EXF7_TRIPS|nr:hypothetical protein T4A_2288 [Trichinella pseudospiralis]
MKILKRPLCPTDRTVMLARIGQRRLKPVPVDGDWCHERSKTKTFNIERLLSQRLKRFSGILILTMLVQLYESQKVSFKEFISLAYLESSKSPDKTPHLYLRDDFYLNKKY